jgi:hypothetical protein
MQERDAKYHETLLNLHESAVYGGKRSAHVAAARSNQDREN